MTTRSHILAYSVGSTLGLIVGTLIGSVVVDEIRLKVRVRR